MIGLGMVKALGSLVAAVLLAGAVTPAAQLMPAIQPGVSVEGVPVGGLTSEPARARVEAAFWRPLRLFHDRGSWAVSPRELGAGAAVDAAIAEALSARPGAEVVLPVRISTTDVGAYVRTLAQRFDRPGLDARLLGLTVKGRPRISPDVPGVAVRREAMAHLLRRALQVGVRSPLPLLLRPASARVTTATFGPVVVIDRARNTLRLFDSTRLVRSFDVATGQARYPTPAGTFRIVRKQRDPWWYPPDSDWARGLSPTPPGPENPLGTRWMGLSARSVGIHGTPSDASIGYSVSHGCIRMHIPEAAWLFGRVRVGTPVVIV